MANSQPAAWRVIDASLNRAGEGLRVVEDHLRFVADDAHLTRVAKQLRHDLHAAAAQLPGHSLAAMRDTLGDVGAVIATSSEQSRTDPQQVCRASLKRVEQALRSMEEYGKLLAPGFASQIEGLRYRCYTLEKAILAGARAAARLADARLYVLIDGGNSAAALAAMVDQLGRSGADVLQLREKGLPDRELLCRARTLVETARPLGVLTIINDRPDIAALAGADGVHLGQDDLSVGEARRLLGPDALIGVSTHAIGQARAAVLDGADYLGAGPTFPSQTKAFDALAGLDYLREVAAEIGLPTFAIGGITPANLSEVLSTGVSRVAVGAAITRAPDLEQMTQAFWAELRGAPSPAPPTPSR